MNRGIAFAVATALPTVAPSAPASEWRTHAGRARGTGLPARVLASSSAVSSATSRPSRASTLPSQAIRQPPVRLIHNTRKRPDEMVVPYVRRGAAPPGMGRAQNWK